MKNSTLVKIMIGSSILLILISQIFRTTTIDLNTVAIKLKSTLILFMQQIITDTSNHIVTSGSAVLSYSLVKDDSRDDTTQMFQNTKLQSPLINYISNKLDKESSFTILCDEDNLLEYVCDNNDSNYIEDDYMDNNYEYSDSYKTDRVLQNEPYFEEETIESIDTVMNTDRVSPDELAALADNKAMINQLTKSLDSNFLLKYFYTVGSKVGINYNTFNVKELLSKDITIKKDNTKPQILILHTHASEAYADSIKGVESDTIVGVGDVLTQLLNDYGYQVIHIKQLYKFNTAYAEALAQIKQILKEYPSIQVILDLHRDDGSSRKTVTIDGKEMATVLFFNGVSENKSGPMNLLKNDNLQWNLSFSLQMKLLAMERYPQFTKKNYLKEYRFNMHLAKRYSLIEVGDIYNTVSDAKNAMYPLADLLNTVLSEKK